MKRTSVIGVALGLATGGLALAVPSSAYAKPYKGAEVLSTETYLHGRMEMRMRMARGSGILSTFFTYKDGSEIEGTFWEEIDIEVFGKDNATTWQSNIITGVGTRVTSEGDHEHHTSLADDYHTYALEWTPDYVAWELDGVEVHRTTGGQVSDLTSPQSLRFNLWAANIESWVGPFDTGALPQYQYVNWIRYYRYEDGQFVHEWTDDFDSFDTARWARADWTFGENLVDFDPNNAVVQDGTLVLALTLEGQTGFNGTVPVDSGGNPDETDDTDSDDTSDQSDATNTADTSDQSDAGDQSDATNTADTTDESDATNTADTTDESDAANTADTTDESDATNTADTTDESDATNTADTSDQGTTTPNTDTSSVGATTPDDDTGMAGNPGNTTAGGSSVDSNVTSGAGGSGTTGVGAPPSTGDSTQPEGNTTGGLGVSGDDNDAGCACRLTSSTNSGHAAPSLLGLGLAWWLRRRKTRPARAQSSSL